MRRQPNPKRPSILTPIAREDLKQVLRGTVAATATLVAFVLVVVSITG